MVEFGSHTGFRCRRLRAWEFESPRAYRAHGHITKINGEHFEQDIYNDSLNTKGVRNMKKFLMIMVIVLSFLVMGCETKDANDEDVKSEDATAQVDADALEDVDATNDATAGPDAPEVPDAPTVPDATDLPDAVTLASDVTGA